MRYMIVSIDTIENGLNLSCWMSPVEFWKEETQSYPFVHTYMGDSCTWLMRANRELSIKQVIMIGETADRICKEQAEINARRKFANR